MDALDFARHAGFETVEAANADDAIAILEAHPNIHVVFTDVQMPGTMDGLKLARFIKDRWSPIKIVATSGRLRVSESDLPEGSIFIPKPYTATEHPQASRIDRRCIRLRNGGGGLRVHFYVAVTATEAGAILGKDNLKVIRDAVHRRHGVRIIMRKAHFAGFPAVGASERLGPLFVQAVLLPGQELP